ncbi:MAG: beta strand repeat-containing protein [Luteolibacter sp.]
MKPNKALRNFLAAIGASMVAVSSASADDFYWSGNGTTQGGNGTWNTTDARWSSLFSGPFSTIWDNSNLDTAVFGGTAGTVNLGAPITIGGLRFDTTGYTINTGSNTLTFGAAENRIVINHSANATNTITGQLAGSGSMIFSAFQPQFTSTLALNGTSTGGWSGTTTINPSMTLVLSQNNQALLNTSGITLNGGGITLTNTNTAEAALNRINDSAAINVNGGGTITLTNTNNANTYAETIGEVNLNRGQMNFVLTNNITNASGFQTLTLSDLIRTGANNTSTVTFSSNSGLNTTKNMIVVNGATATPVGEIIGPWATVGTAAGTQTDYAVYNASSQVVGANIGATTEDTWASGANVTLSDATTLTDTRTLNTLRYTGGAATLALGGNNLETYGVLNGGSGLLTISGDGALTTATGGGQLYLMAGSNNITVNSAINDNGGAVTLVAGGIGRTIILGSTANNYSGGTVINSGILSTTDNSNLGATSGALTFNGSSQWTMGAASAVTYDRSVTYSEGSYTRHTSGNAAKTISGVVSGSGTVLYDHTTTFAWTNTANTFTGDIIARTGNNILTYGFETASLVDQAGVGNMILGNASGGGTFRWIGTGGDKTFEHRQFILGGTTNGGVIQNLSSDNSGLTIMRDLGIEGIGNKTLTLAGTSTGLSTFAGNIGDGPGSVISITKGGSGNQGNWAITGNLSHTGLTTVNGGAVAPASIDALGHLYLSGTNTNTGGYRVISNGTLVFRGEQSLADGNDIALEHGGGTNNGSRMRLLSDTSGTVFLDSTISLVTSNAVGSQGIFVGNNNTANLGNSSGTTTGSTIRVSNLNFTQVANSPGANGIIAQITGANDYSLQIDNVTLHSLSNVTSTSVNMGFNPTTANVSIGNITQANGNGNGATPILNLQGTTTGNMITGAISDAADFTDSSNANAAALEVLKTNTAGAWTLTGNSTYTGSTTIAGGRLEIGGSATLGHVSAGVGNYAGNIAISNNNSGRLVYNSSSTQTLGGVISGNGAFHVEDGTVILTGDNTYTGATLVNAGSLIINGSTAGSTITVASGATLGGSGTVGGLTTINGFLNPGNSPGVIEFEAGLTLGSTSTTTMEIAGIVRDTQYDGVDVTGGTLTYGGALVLDLQTLFGGGSYTFNLFDAINPASGEFSSIVFAGAFYSGSFADTGSGVWSASTNSGNESWIFDHNDGNLYLTVIPEPKTALLGAIGFLMLFRRRR